MTLTVLSVLLICISSAVTQDITFVPAKEEYDPTSDFRKDYTFVSGSRCYYKEHKTPKTWHDAVKTCKGEGAQLASPFSKNDSDFLSHQLSYDTDFVWLGIHDLYSEGSFYTLNGTSVDDIYTNWIPGEPSDAGGNEDCVTMSKIQEYDDNDCQKKFKFVCTKHQSEHTYLTSCETTDKKYFLEPSADRCYKLHIIPKNWHEASDMCLNEGASLAMVDSKLEADIFLSNMVRYPEHTLRGNFNKKIILMGFSDLLIPGEFLTTEGQTLADYDEWADGEPDNRDGKEHCGGMDRDGKLSDVSCDERAYFFCEKKLGGTLPTRIEPKISIDSGTTTLKP